MPSSFIYPKHLCGFCFGPHPSTNTWNPDTLKHDPYSYQHKLDQLHQIL